MSERIVYKTIFHPIHSCTLQINNHEIRAVHCSSVEAQHVVCINDDHILFRGYNELFVTAVFYPTETIHLQKYIMLDVELKNILIENPCNEMYIEIEGQFIGQRFEVVNIENIRRVNNTCGVNRKLTILGDIIYKDIPFIMKIYMIIDDRNYGVNTDLEPPNDTNKKF